MTLIEVLMVVGIVGLLSAFLVPIAKKAFEYKENSLVAHKLRTATQAFALYRSEEGSYPGDVNRAVVPAGMAEFFDYFDPKDPEAKKVREWWAEATEIGGNFDWDKHGDVCSVSIVEPTRDSEQLEDLDKMIDDGNLSSGNFRAFGSRYKYILEE